LPLPLPDTEEKFWQFAMEWAQSLRDLKPAVPAVPAVPARRRGRPRGDARIAAQQRKRVRLFLAEYLGAGKKIEEATATVVNKYGVNRRTVARDRKAHEHIERLPPQIRWGGIGLALEIWRCLKDWRPPPRYSLSSALLAQYYGTTGDTKSAELMS